MALNLSRRPDALPQVGTPLVAKRVLSVAPRNPGNPAPNVGVLRGCFRLVVKQEKGGEPYACPLHLETPELARLTRALAYAFSALQRVDNDRVTEADNFPAITSWIAGNKTHWSLGRNLLVTASHELIARQPGGFTRANIDRSPAHGLPCMTFVDPPDSLRNDPHPETVSNDKCIRDAYAAAGWLTVIAKPITPIKRVFAPATKTPAPASGLVPRKPLLALKRGTPDDDE